MNTADPNESNRIENVDHQYARPVARICDKLLDSSSDVNIKLGLLKRLSKHLYKELSQTVERKIKVCCSKVVETVIGILSETNPSLTVGTPEQQLRKGALDLVWYIGNEKLSLLERNILKKFFIVLINLYEEDNEDNFLLGLKIIVDHFKSKILPPYLVLFCKKLLLVYKSKVTDVNMRQGRTHYASIKESYVYEGEEMLILLPKASESLCVLAEIPELILLTLNQWSTKPFSYGFIDNMTHVFLKIINLSPDEESRGSENFNLNSYIIILKIQINILNLLAHVYCMYLTVEEDFREAEFAVLFFKGIVLLLTNCPANTEFLREKILNVLNMSLKTKLKKHLLVYLPQLLIDSYLYNRELDTFKKERPLYFHTLLKYINEIIPDFDEGVIMLITRRFLPLICDLTLPIQINICLCDILIKFSFRLSNEKFMLELIHSFNDRLELFAVKELPYIIKMHKKCNKFFDKNCPTTMSYSKFQINRFGEDHLCSLNSILEYSSKKKFPEESRNCFRISDCKKLIKIIIEDALSVIKYFKTDNGQDPLDYVQPFSKLLKSLVVAISVFRIPNTSHSVQKVTLQEEKLVLIELSKIFCHFSSEEFYKIFEANMNIILHERNKNPALQIFLQSLLFDSSKTKLLSSISLNFIIVHMKQFDNSFPTLSCLLNDVLRAMLKFPQNAELLNRYLWPMIKKCIAIIPSTKVPRDILKVIISLMVLIKAGHFEDIFNNSLQLYLSLILQTMITWFRTSIRKCFQDDVLEVCLSIVMNCNSKVVMSVSLLILTPVVYALNRNNSYLILRALKVLQAICHFNNEFINSHILSLRGELLYGLHHALNISSEKAKEIIFQLLIQFHNPQQNLQIQLKHKPSILNVPSINANTQDKYRMNFISKGIHHGKIQCKGSADTLFDVFLNITKYFLAANYEDYKHPMSQISRFNLKKSHLFPDFAVLKSRHINKVVLKTTLAVISRTPHPPAADDFLEKYLSYWIIYYFYGEFGLLKNSREIIIESVVVIDSIIEFVSSHSGSDAKIKNVINTGIKSLNILIENSEILIKEISSNKNIWHLSFFHHMIKSVCNLPYENKLHMKLFSCEAIKLLFKKFSKTSRCIFSREFLQHLLYLIEDFTIDQNFSNIGNFSIKDTLGVIISFICEKENKICFRPCLEMLLSYITSPSENVRTEVRSHLGKICTALKMDIYRLIQPVQKLFPNFLRIDELLKRVPLKSKIGIIDSYAFCVYIFKYDVVKQPQYAKSLINLAELCNNVIDNKFNVHSKDCIYYIKLCQAAFKVFCYFSFESSTTEDSAESIDKCLAVDFYFSIFQHFYVMQQNQMNYASLLFVNAERTNFYKRYMSNFFEIIKRFLARMKPANFSELDSCIGHHTGRALSWLHGSTEKLITDLMNTCVQQRTNEDSMEFFLILKRWLDCNPERNLKFFYFKYLKTCYLQKKIFLLSSLKNSVDDVRWNKAIKEIFYNTEPSAKALLKEDFQQLTEMLFFVREPIFQETGSQHFLSKVSFPDERTCCAITILYFLKEHDVYLYQNKEIIWRLRKSWIQMNNSLSKNIHYDIKLTEFRQLAEFLLETYKSSTEIELLFDLLRAPIEQIPHHFNFITDFFKNIVVKRYSNKWKETAFLTFIYYHYKRKYSSDLRGKILEFLFIPSLIFSMKKGNFKISKPMMDGVLICIEDLKVVELNLRKSLLRFFCLILECACHNVDDYFSRKLKDYVKTSQIEKYYFHPSTKSYWNLFWIYLSKATKTKLNEDLIPEVFQNSIKSYGIDVQEISTHVLNILISTVCLESNWRSYFTHWTKWALEIEFSSNVNLSQVAKQRSAHRDNQISIKEVLEDSLRLKHIFLMIFNHFEAFDIMNISFVLLLLKTAHSLLHSSVVKYKKIAVDVLETLLKHAEVVYKPDLKNNTIKTFLQMCGDLLMDFTNAYPTNKSSKKLYKKSKKLLKRIFDLHSFEELFDWLYKTDSLSIYNHLEILNYLLSKYQHLAFGFAVKYIIFLLNFFKVSKVSELFWKLIRKLNDFIQVKFCNMSLNIKSVLETVFEVIELVLKRTVWQPLTTIHWGDILNLSFKDFPSVMNLVILLFKKIVKSFENILCLLLKFSTESYFNNSVNTGKILDFFEFIDTWLDNFVLSEIEKYEIVIPDVNTEQFRKFTDAFILRCLMESLGWLILKLVVNVYPKYLNSKKYINFLETILKNYLKHFSADDKEGTQKIHLRDTKTIMALQIIELGCSEMIYCDKIVGLLKDLMMRTKSKTIVLIIMNIIKKWCVFDYHHKYRKKKIILKLIEKLAASIGQKFTNDSEVCDLYFEIIEVVRLIYRNSDITASSSSFSKISFKSELYDIQKRFFCLFNKITSKDIYKQMMYLTSKSYWKHSTSFYFAPWVQLVISCFKEDPRIRCTPFGSMQRKKILNKKYTYSSEHSNNADFYGKYDQKTQIVKRLESFKMDLSTVDDSCFCDAVQKLIYFDDSLAEFLWNKLLPKAFSVLSEHSRKHIAGLIEDFVQRELTKNKGKNHTEKILSFANIYLRNLKPSLVNHSFLELIGNFPNLHESSCLYLEDCVLQNPSCLESNCKKSFNLLIKTYSFLHENDLLNESLLEDGVSLFPVTNKILQNNYQQLKDNFNRIATKHSIASKLPKKLSILFPKKADAYTRNPIGIKCLKEIDNWSNLRRSDKTIAFNSDIHSEIKKILYNMKILFSNEKASLVAVSDSIRNLVNLCTDKWKSLSPLFLTEKHYSLIKVRKKISYLEIAHLFQKLLLNRNSSDCLSNLMNILESWYFYNPVDDDLLFWEDIFKVRLCLLQHLPLCLSVNVFKDKAQILKVKHMAQLTYTVTQIHRANLYLSQGFLKKGVTILNCIQMKSSMNEYVMQLYMKSIFLQMEQYDNDVVKIESLLEKASSFLELKICQPTSNEQQILYFIYNRVISALREKNSVAKEAFCKPCHDSTDLSMGWIYCGKYFQKIFPSNNEKRYLELAMRCFVKACKYKNAADIGDLLARILWIFSYDDSLSKSFIDNGGEDILISFWLPWIPQLLTTILRSSSCNLRFLLYSIGMKYPNSLYLLLNIFLKKIASKPDKRGHAKCFTQILCYLEVKNPELCYTLRNISNEFLVLARNIRPDGYNALKKIESGICDTFFQSLTKQIDVDIINKVSDIFLEGFNNLEERRDYNIPIVLKELFELRKSGDLNHFLHKLSSWIAYYETEKAAKKPFPLKRISIFLSTFHLHQEKIDMFMNPYFKPSCVQISRFLPTIEIMEGYDKAYRILIQGDNGKIYPYLIIHNMCSENIFQEDRIFQFFTLLNSLMAAETYWNHSLQLKIPTFLCIHPCLKMVQSVISSYSLLDIYNQHCASIGQQNRVIPACLKLFSNIYCKKLIQGLDLSSRLEIFKFIQKCQVPNTVLKKKFVDQSAASYMESRKLFAEDIALIGISRFLFILNKQMPENIFINLCSGEVLTFGLKFNMLNVHENKDICLPFRLTENISEFITPFGISGYVKSTILRSIRCFCKHADKIESFLKILLLDEFDNTAMNIYKPNHHKRISKITQSITQKIEDYADENVAEQFIQLLLLTSRNLDDLSLTTPSWYPWL